MPYRKEQFETGEIYHVVIRGIDDNVIFKNVDDYYRGIFSIYEFNNSKPVVIRERRRARIQFKKLQKSLNRDPDSAADQRKRLVDILAFCFMPNHLHLLMRQSQDGGIIKFMNKVGSGYAGYYNRKYGRKGYVFQNRFVAVRIKNDDQLKTVLAYIHANPISLIESKWKEKGVKNIKRALNFLENYKWSSYQDYIEKKNFPSVTEREFISEIVGGLTGSRNLLKNWVKYKGKKSNYRVPDSVSFWLE